MDTIPHIDDERGIEPEFSGFPGSLIEYFLPAPWLERREIMFFLIDTDLLHDLESLREKFYELIIYLVYLVSKIGKHKRKIMKY